MTTAHLDSYQRLSPSSRRAFGYALAAAWVRAGHHDTAVEPDDLLVGLLLAHPDQHGEARTLLAHFGLTGRDVLADGYPPLAPDELHRQAATITVDDQPPLSPPVEKALISLSTGYEKSSAAGDSTVHLRQLLGALLATRSDLTEQLDKRLTAASANLRQVVEVYNHWLADPKRQQLREVLEREMPRRPVDVPTYAPDRVGTGDDLIGIGREVDAFAYLLASKAQRPPLAVGLFGDWGSGKSFFMHAVRNRIEQIGVQIAGRSQAEMPFWKNIRQIEFNAWEYVQGNLWASLIDNIFQKLNGALIGSVRDRHKELATARNNATKVADEHAENRDKLFEQIEEREAAVQKAEVNRDTQRKQLIAARGSQIEETLIAAQRVAWRHQAATLAGKDATELAVAVGDARDVMLRGRGLLGPYWTARRIAIATAVALMVPAVALAAEALRLPTVVSLLGALAVLVPAITGLLRSSTDWMRKAIEDVEKVDEEIDGELAKLDDAVDQARADLRDSQEALDQTNAAELAARAEADTFDGELKELTPSRVLGEFVQERSSASEYRRHLGLLADVRRDLEKLEKLVRENNDAGVEPAEGGPPNRIILYIDDLDRCPSKKVLEVLEAVHLLLAFELFVVVVAVDARWLSVALTDELRALKPDREDGQCATPQDYLEKIFQLPFWVQPLTTEGRRTLVHGLLEGSVRNRNGSDHDAAAGVDRGTLTVGKQEREALSAMLSRRGANPRLDAHLLALTPTDLTFIKSLAPLLGNTPRRVKRFVNVTQLLLALPPSFDDSTQRPSDRSIVAFLAALISGLPTLAAALFDRVELNSMRLLGESLDSLDPPFPYRPEAFHEEQQKLAEWLRDQPDWALLPLGRLSSRLEVVRRLTFDRSMALSAS